MSSNLKAVRLFYRHFNYTSTSASRKKCALSLRHSLRVSPSNDSVKKLEWNPELSHNNRAMINDKEVKLSELSDVERENIISDIAPEMRMRNHTKLKTQYRQYKAKLKKAVLAEYKQGNEQAADFIQSLLDRKDIIDLFEVQLAKDMTMTRPKQRLGAIKKYIEAHNQFVNKPRSEKYTYVQEGIFKIPAKWEVGSDIISLSEYMRFTKQFLLHHFPNHPAQLIIGHDDERLEVENTGLHTHYYLSGCNSVTGEYDLRLREIELVNEYLKSQGRENELLPQNGALKHNQTQLLGQSFQAIVQEYTNKWLLNPKGLNAEFSDEAEKRTKQYQHMNQQAKLPKSQRDYNYQSRTIKHLKLDIKALRETKTIESTQLNEIKGDNIVLKYEFENQRIDNQAQLDEMEYNLLKLNESIESSYADLEEIEQQALEYQQEMEQAVKKYIALESYSQKQRSELARVEMVLAEKETELQNINVKVKKQMQDILMDSYMLMQAKHKRFSQAAHKYANKISQRLEGDIPLQLEPLLNAALNESGYEPGSRHEIDF